MPRYFFHIVDDVGAQDEEGVILPDLEAAQAYGLKGLRSLAIEQVQQGALNLAHRIEITNELGELVQAVHMRDAIEVTG